MVRQLCNNFKFTSDYTVTAQALSLYPIVAQLPGDKIREAFSDIDDWTEADSEITYDVIKTLLDERNDSLETVKKGVTLALLQQKMV